MATLVLAAVGTAFGGPVGRAVGALIGNQIDHAILGPGGTREGPRLKELAVTTSSYGQPMPRQFGRMRVGGTIIWATDIQESSSRESNGKGQPSTTTYSYSASFAVALSSTPLGRVGRVWADGNLLRGAAGDLKVQGEMRTYLGGGNDPIDPLISADKGAQATAFRDCAYVVFEGLALADYGNRVPALTFEIFAQDETRVLINQIVPEAVQPNIPTPITHARGFADEGGAVVRSLATIAEVLPLTCVTTAEGVRIAPIDQAGAPVLMLPERLAAIDDNETRERPNRLGQASNNTPLALRYYDEDRDYQPGVQRAVGIRRNGRENMVDLPATMTASGARQLANDNAQRARWRRERIVWRVGVLDQQVQPGVLVSLPDTPGVWRVVSWEWYERGIELELERVPPQVSGSIASDPGAVIAPIDQIAPATLLDFFEVPSDGTTSSATRLLYAAASAESSAWRGASLLAEHGNTLVPIGFTRSARAVMGALVDALEPSDGLVFEANASMMVVLVGDGLGFESSDISGLAAGANRLMVGSEVIQFADAQPLDSRRWLLSGLLRGRAGTEDFASQGHTSGTKIGLLDSRLTALDTTLLAAQTATRIASVGLGDATPVYANLRNQGSSWRPPCPVHPCMRTDGNGDFGYFWTRRARGSWGWADGVDVPLVEEIESFQVGYGDTELPFATWSTSSPQITLTSDDRASLVSIHGPAPLWVKQIGTFGVSPALLLANFA